MTHFLPSPPSTAILIPAIDLPWHHLQWVISQPQSVKAAADLPACVHTHTRIHLQFKHTDNHSLFSPSLAELQTHTSHVLGRVRQHERLDHYRTRTGIIALTRPNCPPFICMSAATHILRDSPFDKEGSFPPAKKMKPSRYCLIGFCSFQGFRIITGIHLKCCWKWNRDLLPAFNYSNTTLFFLFCVRLQSVQFREIKIIRLALKWDQDGPIFTQEVI